MSNDDLRIWAKVKTLINRICKIGCPCKIKVNKNINLYFKSDDQYKQFVLDVNNQFTTSYTIEYIRTNWVTGYDIIEDLKKL